MPFKDYKRRGVETFLQAIGASDTTVDTVYVEEYEKFQLMVDDLNEIGAGLSEYLISLKSNYGLGNDLATVLDSYYNGELARDWTSSNPGLSNLTLHQQTLQFCAAWKENDEIVRKSVAHVWIERGLTPMRAFVNTVTPDIESACQQREDYRKDADSYRRRYQKAVKAAQTATTPEKKQAAQQEQAQLNAKLDRATKVYEDQNALVKVELEKAKLARDQAIEMMVTTVAACQMELFEQSYKRLVGATSSFPSDKMNQVRTSVQNMIRAGGPNPSDTSSGPSMVSQVGNVMTGKAVPNDYKQQAARRESQEAKALEQARAVAMADEQARAGGGVGFSAAQKRTSNGPPLPPKRGGGPPALPSRGAPAPAIPSRAAPPAIPSRAPAPAIPSRAPAPAIPSRAPAPAVPKWGGAGGGVKAGPPVPPVRGGAPAIPSRAPAAAPAVPKWGGAGGGAKAGPPALPAKKTGPPPPPRAGGGKPTATALFDNVPDDSDELAFGANDKIEIIKEDGSGWWEGRHVKSGKKGIFPANFVKKD